MSSSIGCRRSVIGRAGAAPVADNDRGPAERQARLRRAVAAVLVLMALFLLAEPALAEGDATETRPLEIQRQQIDGRLGTIERKQEDAGRLPVPGSRLDPCEPAPPPSETRGARERLELE